jgi:acetyl-CoA/propionyl-CoA carboxylase biotin carboxyl carrier protein
MATVAVTWAGDGAADAGRALVSVDGGPERTVRVLGPAADAVGADAVGAGVIRLEVEDQQHTFAIGVSGTSTPTATIGGKRGRGRFT